jgi:hypothetical protein
MYFTNPVLYKVKYSAVAGVTFGKREGSMERGAQQPVLYEMKY